LSLELIGLAVSLALMTIGSGDGADDQRGWLQISMLNVDPIPDSSLLHLS
jgi:hypothetical protein